MNRRMKTLLMSALAASVAGLSGCAAGPEAATASGSDSQELARPGRWIPSASPSFATLARSTTYALAHAENSDLLVIDQDVLSDNGQFVIGKLTWLVPLPKDPVFNQPLRVGGRGAQAWVLEEVQSGETHAAPAEGSVTIQGLSADTLTATLNMTSSPEDMKAGVVSPPTIALDGRFEFMRYTPETPQYNEMQTRRGIDPAAKLPPSMKR